MRISDWSSDVCSSDLHAAAVEVAVGHGGRAVCELHHDGCQVELAPDHLARRQAGQEGAGHLLQLLAGGVLLQHGVLWIHRVGRLEVGVPERLVRSEEHTSELQSLMRISYAVFCLKK